MQRLKADECAENKRLLGAQPQTRRFYKLPQGTGVAHRPGGAGAGGGEGTEEPGNGEACCGILSSGHDSALPS